ncbi:MAG: hypothetical protein ABIB97_04880 [Patescibacteria group bacterium]
MEDKKQLGLKWKPTNYFIIGGVVLCLGLIVLVIGKLLGAYLVFLAGIALLIWPVSRVMGKNQNNWTIISIVVYLLIAYYIISRQFGDFPTWKTALLVIWSLALLAAYLFSFRKVKTKKI